MGKTVDASHLMNTYGGYEIVITRGEGCRLIDQDGRSYLDFLGGISVVSLGHANPEVAKTIAAQASTLIHTSNFFYNPWNLELSERICQLIGGGEGQVFFSNSGTEANEAAIKLARRYGGGKRYKIVCFDNGFHGRTLGALAATGQPSKQAPFQPLPEGFVFVPFDDLVALKDALSDPQVVAMLVEPIQAEGGIVDPSPGFLEDASRAACERGVLVMIDEIQTGMCRTGDWFGFQHHGISPDVVTMAKALGNGYPIGATWARPQVASSFVPGDHGSTFGGNALGAAVACCVIEQMEKLDILQRVKEKGSYLRSQVSALLGVESVSGRGLLLGVHLSEPVAKDIVRLALKRGLVLNALSDRVVRLAPPLVVEDSEIDEAVDIMKICIQESGHDA